MYQRFPRRKREQHERIVSLAQCQNPECGKWTHDPRQHDERGRVTDCVLCRECSEMLMARAMRLEMASEVKQREE